MKYVIRTRGKAGQFDGNWTRYMKSIYPGTADGLEKAQSLAHMRNKTYIAWEFKVFEMHNEDEYKEIPQRGCGTCEHSFFRPESQEWECSVNERGIIAYMTKPEVKCGNWEQHERTISIPHPKESHD